MYLSWDRPSFKGDWASHLSMLAIIATFVRTAVILTLFTLSTEIAKSSVIKRDRMLGHMKDPTKE